MKLATYLTRHKLSDAEFAVRSGVFRTKVWAYRTGRLVPGSRSAARIVAATNGEVAFEDLIPAAPRRPSRRPAA